MSNDKNESRNISLKCDEKVSRMLDELEEELLLNTSSVLRMAIRHLYLKEIDKMLPNYEGDE